MTRAPMFDRRRVMDMLREQVAEERSGAKRLADCAPKTSSYREGVASGLEYAIRLLEQRASG